LAGEEGHEAFHINPAHPLRVVEVNPDTFNPDQELPQVIAICLDSQS